MSTVEDDPYTVLGVARFSTVESCRKAFHRLLFRLHPDHGGTDADRPRLEAVLAAWDCLSDDARRADLNAMLRRGSDSDDAARARFRDAGARWSTGGGETGRAMPRWYDPERGTVDSVDRCHAAAALLHTHALLTQPELAEVVACIDAAPEVTLPALAEALAVVVVASLGLDEDHDRLTAAAAATHVARRAALRAPEDGAVVDVRATATQMTASGTDQWEASRLTAGWAPVATLLPPWLRRRWLTDQAAAATRGRRW